jgi:hypothetical protein
MNQQATEVIHGRQAAATDVLMVTLVVIVLGADFLP